MKLAKLIEDKGGLRFWKEAKLQKNEIYMLKKNFGPGWLGPPPGSVPEVVGFFFFFFLINIRWVIIQKKKNLGG